MAATQQGRKGDPTGQHGPATQQQQEQQPTMIVPPSNAGVEPKAMMVEARHAFVTFAAMPGFGRHLKNTAVLAPRDGIRNATGY